jgi:MFS family permease
MTGEPAPGLRRNRNWLLLWTGQAISITGTYIFNTTVVLWVATIIARDRPWGPQAVGGVLIAAAVPALVIGPVAGVFVDRWNRRRTMLTCDACCTVLIAALLLLPAAGSGLAASAKLAILYAVVAAVSCISQFFGPSRTAVLQSVVAPADRARAMGLAQSMVYAAAIIGPPIAAPLLFVSGVQWALAINAASFAVSFAATWLIRITSAVLPGPDGADVGLGFRREFAAGLRFFRGSPALVAIGIGVVVATLGTGALNVLMVYFLKANLHTVPKWLGTIDAAEGAGGVLGALGAGWVAARIGSRRVLWAGLVAAGVALVGLSRATALPPALVIMACTGLFAGAVNVAISAIMLEVTPQQMLGRVVSVVNPLVQLASIVSMGGFGFLAGTVLAGLHARVAGLTFGPYDTIFGACGLIIVASGLLVIRPLRVTEPSSTVAAVGEAL